MIKGVTQEGGISCFVRRLLNLTEHRRKVRVRDIGENDADGHGVLGHQTAGKGVGSIVIFSYGGFHTGTFVLCNGGSAV